MNRRTFIKNMIAVSGGVLAGEGLVSASSRLSAKFNRRRPPNVVFVYTDDQGWGDLGCYGHPDIMTPNLDQLAMEGIKFEQFYVSAPVCSPSRAGLMSGQFPSRLGFHTIIGNPSDDVERNVPHYIDPNAPMITKLFRNAGYRVGHFGKWHITTKKNPDGYDIPVPDDYGIDDFKTAHGSDGYAIWEDWERETHRPISTELIIDEGIRFIEENKERPFFLNLWTYDPHKPLLPTEEMREPYSSFSEPQQTYYSVITYIDQQVQRVIDKLKEVGLSEDTIILFSSDNGPEIEGSTNCGSAGPFRGKKRSLYEGGIREPFILRWKGHIKPGQVDSTSAIAGTDMLPSLCSIAGIELPEYVNIDGEDMSQALLGQPQQRIKPIMWEYRGEVMGPDTSFDSPIMAIRDGDWKLLWNPDDSRTELYNIVNDPTESNEVSSQYPQIVADLKAKLQQFYDELPEDRWKDPMAGKIG